MRPILLIALLARFALPALAEGPATAVVQKTDFTIEVAAEGRVAPGTVVEVRLSPLVWRARYTVTSALLPGSTVSQGDVVLRFEDREIRKALDNARFGLSVAEREFAAQMERLRMKGRAADLELTGKKRELEVSRNALKNYLEYTLPRAAARAERDAKSYARSVENSRDELAQLEMMYAEDELVDETEEIVLKRARWDLENRLANQATRRQQREFDVRFSEVEHKRSLDLSLRGRTLSLARAEMEFELGRVARLIEAEKALRGIEEKRRNVAELAADLSDFILRAPCAGVLLHGDRNGSLDREHKVGAQLLAESVAFIIVDPTDLKADLNVAADEILRVSTGQGVRMKVSATGQDDVSGVITTRSIMPRGGRIPLTVRPATAFSPALLGISVKGRVRISALKDVLVVPVGAVQREGTKALCRRPLEGGGTRLVPVILGPDDGKLVVVLEGLSEGDVVIIGEPRE